MINRTRVSLYLALLATVFLLGGCSLISTVINTAIPLAGAKLQFACIPEGTLVDTPAGPRPIESLRAGEQVIGYAGKPVKVLMKHCYAEDPKATEFLTVELAGGRKVDLCGMHRICGMRAKDLASGTTVHGSLVRQTLTYRGVKRSYDLLTEDAGYRIQGVPVNSMIEEMYAAGRTGLVPSEE